MIGYWHCFEYEHKAAIAEYLNEKAAERCEGA